ncbi:hypothetical protein [Nocardia sp. CDC160]|uniref:hypothetical protein n=1 Tax=Nocardia sp. CDC160 TaxID=3112166 RepID=UPI002DB7DD7C|nr:hypothetical protein [Nocardia sp. CDC160]MEC3919288.1 hypothetical protein [Nocardia sp. CDC160]
MHPRLAGLQDFLLPEDFRFDFSASSLTELEAVLLDGFDTWTAVANDIDDNPQGFIVRAAGYLGETLMRAGGGAWIWDKLSAQPLASFDPALRLSPIAPLVVLAQAADRGTGRVLTDSLETVRAAVTQYQHQHPDWSPVKQATPALDPDPDFPPDLGTLTAWCHQRESRFQTWATEYTGGSAKYDFSVDSLDLLERLVKSRLSGFSDFERPENQEFIDGAIWYLGETIVRQGKAQWRYIEGERNEDSEWVGRPFLKQTEPPNNSVVPELTLMNCAEFDDPNCLRGEVALFEDRRSHR